MLIKPAPINVTWMITDRCNYNCQFCFRFLGRPELNYHNAVNIIDKLSKSGVRKISWAGGEPLLWPRMLDLIEYTHSLGITTMLITNGSLLNSKILKRLVKSLDWLNFPLDGPDDATNAQMTRNKGHYQRIITLLESLSASPISLKINTVATSVNIAQIPQMVQLINKYSVHRWKIFQFYPIRGTSCNNASKFIISTQQFQKLQEQIISQKVDSRCMLVFESNRDMDNSYFSLAPDGSVYVSSNGHDKIIGNLTKDSVENIWKSDMINKMKYWLRASWFLNNSK